VRYKHLFFDWDHTLWDFEKNSEMSLRSLFLDLELQALGMPSFELFFEKYIAINDLKWDLYRQGKITKQGLRESRFQETFAHFGVEANDVAWTLETRYIDETPYQNHLIQGARQVLETLKQRGYTMHIITNGFHESQNIKFSESGLKIYRRALQLAGAERKESLMIGDNLIADCVGAREQGIDQVFFNPKRIKHTEKVTHEIEDLEELLGIV